MDPFLVEPVNQSSNSDWLNVVLILSAFLGSVLKDVAKGGIKWYVAVANALKQGPSNR